MASQQLHQHIDLSTLTPLHLLLPLHCCFSNGPPFCFLVHHFNTYKSRSTESLNKEQGSVPFALLSRFDQRAFPPCSIMHAPTVLCLALFLSTTLVPATAADSLAVGQSIKDNETLISAEGTFVLGFFTGRSNHRYLGIWYNRIPGPTVVWVANRQRPLSGTTGSLAVSRDGNLVLADARGTIYWSTGPTPVLSSPVALLLDDGNLVVLDERGSGYAWQSFAHPADTVLPGMTVGLDRRTGERFYVTSWRSPDDPAPGNFSGRLDTRGVPQLLVMNGSTPLWRGGPWVGDRFIGIPGMKANKIFNYGFTSNSDDLYFKYGVWNRSMFSRIVINQSGFLEHLVWEYASSSWSIAWASGKGTCEGIGACGPYGLCDETKSQVCGCPEGFEPKQQQQEGRRGAIAAAGCVRKAPLDCRDGGDTFVVVPSSKLPDTSAATLDEAVGLDDCKAACLRNCSCTAFASSDGSGCITWFGDLTDLTVYSNGGQDLFVRVAAPGQGGKGQKKTIIIIIMLIAFVMIMLALLTFFCRRRQMSKKRLKDMQHNTVEEWHYEEHDQGSDFDLPLFHFSTLEIATNYFSFQNKLGEGGYGPVYKGKLHDGQCIAIKRLSKDSTQGLEQFKSEVQLVAKLQHTNLVRLLGCCIENEEKILVYEYMQNQSLNKFIFDADRGGQLDWAKRLHIIEGITQGLLYLHQYSRLRVIHRDLKASNILLDDEWNPKISDFGLARIFSWNEPQANTKRIIGTYGYIAPEYAMKGLFSVKSDVFSFGVLLLEILSGKKSTSIIDFGISRNLPAHAWELWREGRELELVDPAMGNLVPGNEFAICIHVALLCVQENPVDRPTMLDVVSMLNNDSTTSLPKPNQPAFFLVRHSTEEGNNFEIEQFSSSNSVTFSRIEGR